MPSNQGIWSGQFAKRWLAVGYQRIFFMEDNKKAIKKIFSLDDFLIPYFLFVRLAMIGRINPNTIKATGVMIFSDNWNIQALGSTA